MGLQILGHIDGFAVFIRYRDDLMVLVLLDRVSLGVLFDRAAVGSCFEYNRCFHRIHFIGSRRLIR